MPCWSRMKLRTSPTPIPALRLRGAGAGLLATLAMSTVMLGARRLGISPLLAPDAGVAAAHLVCGAVAPPSRDHPGRVRTILAAHLVCSGVPGALRAADSRGAHS